MDAAVIGGSGYTGGELLRLLLQHPDVDLVGATSQSLLGKPLHQAHPNLRGATDLRFAARDQVPDADVVFLCMPHGESQRIVPGLLETGHTVIDLAADYRLRDPDVYRQWYGNAHATPELLAEAVYGLPEVSRAALPQGRLVSGVGCFATAMNLALLPLAGAGLLEGATVVVDGKIGSSAAGTDTNPAGMHAARSRSLRLYAPTEHRHVAEVAQVCGIQPHVSVHAVELVRGILATCHVMLPGDVPDDKELWRLWRDRYSGEPFVRIVNERSGPYRLPEPKLLAGTNYCDVGFERDPLSNRVVVVAAIDNLVKGAAGQAVQAMNLMMGWDETLGLGFTGLHPV